MRALTRSRVSAPRGSARIERCPEPRPVFRAALKPATPLSARSSTARESRSAEERSRGARRPRAGRHSARRSPTAQCRRGRGVRMLENVVPAPQRGTECSAGISPGRAGPRAVHGPSAASRALATAFTATPPASCCRGSLPLGARAIRSTASSRTPGCRCVLGSADRQVLGRTVRPEAGLTEHGDQLVGEVSVGCQCQQKASRSSSKLP